MPASEKSFLAYLADRLDEARAVLGGIDSAPGAERLDGALARSVTSLRVVGVFQSSPRRGAIGPADLERLYAYDELLLDGVHALLERLGRVAETEIAGETVLGPLTESAEHLAHAIEQRGEVFAIHGH